LEELRDRIDEVLNSDTTAEKLDVSAQQGDVIDKHMETDPLCQDCKFRLTKECASCLFIMQSPLERKLFVELKKEGIYFKPQYPLGYDGKKAYINEDEDQSTRYKKVLTIVDFYIEYNQMMLCVYTDGHTYHERTEDQATRDKNIDRKLQDLGYKVFRFTGKEVNERMPKVIDDIKSAIDKAKNHSAARRY
ncbi:MAG: DUF559 domain-containing protein, partial [Sphingobacteriales bacterium]